MHINNHNIKRILAIILLFLILSLSIYLIYQITMPIKSKTIQIFHNEYDMINESLNVIMDIKSEYVDITKKTNSDISVHTVDDIEGYIEIQLDDENFNILKKLLNKKKIKSISKYNDSAYYTIYAKMGCGYGVAYSIDGRVPNDETITFLDRIEGKENWYYYEMR